MKIIIDSSVWIAAIGSKKGYASEVVLKSYKNSQIEILISNKILDEVSRNLSKKLNFKTSLAWQAGKTIRNLCDFEVEIFQDEEKKITRIKYEPDKHILALCRKTQANFLITFDRKHLLLLKKFSHTKILEPKDFIKLIKNI